ncbi:unnamed protein product [Miscanthus lutarioriparius]|uniref:Uncharacterized protein n=1 Tax=Miscanthus lutarioriparius TaxID=422564 RepID=A0A811Q532_9POAL|nr:unnamed protein product [Miscanthus lutarioriparius]
MAQAILGSSSAKVDIVNPEALSDPDDERKLFVAAWCMHPDLIPNENIMAVLQPEEEHDEAIVTAGSFDAPRPRTTPSSVARQIEDYKLVPKRRARLVARSKHRARKLEVQARKVMMKRLGVDVKTELPKKASFEEF